MRTARAATAAILLAIGTSASAHNLDEYLQATKISVQQDRVQAQVCLTPGVLVFPRVLASIDANHDGVFSKAEQQSYAERVRRDLSLSVDGAALPLQLVSWNFAKITDMKEGRGSILLDFHTAVPTRVGGRKLTFENRHQSRIATYLVNCLIPRDQSVQVTAQRRSYEQSHYELDYDQASVPSSTMPATWRPGIPACLGAAALLLFAPFAWLLRRATPANEERA